MRLTWTFKSRNGDHRNGQDHIGEELNNGTGDPRPDFLCVGAQKAGTSWLYRQLESHPDFWMPPVKELHYFDNLNRTKPHHPPRHKDGRDAYFLEGIKDLSMRSHIDLDSYGRLFYHKGPLLSGDISPAYSTLTDEIIERVVNHFPKMRVVFLARDPVGRAWSQLSTGVRLGMISSFDPNDAEELIRNLLNPGCAGPLASQQNRRALEALRSPGKLPRLFLRRSKGKPRRVAAINSPFSGGDPDKPSGGLKPHENNDAGREKLLLTAKVRDRMAQFFQQELKACAAKLGGRAKSWPARYGFSLLLFIWDLLDDSIDLFFWCDWIS